MMNGVSKVLIGIFLTSLLGTQTARSATFSLNFNEPTTVLPHIVYSSVDTIGSDAGQVLQGITGTDGDKSKYLSPWIDTLYWDHETQQGAKYTNVGKNRSATYEFIHTYTSVSFLWGSVDAGQGVLFYNGNTAVDYLNSDDVLNLGATEGDGFVQISITAVPFDKIIFRSQNNSFEFSNLSVSSVPLPAAFPLYAAGLLVLGLIGRLRPLKKGAAS